MANSKIYLGNTNIGSLFQGASDISIYLGVNKVYPLETPLKFQATYSGGETYSAECNGSVALSSGDTKPSGYEYSAMTDAMIGDCITIIGDSAFSGCSNLSSCTISSGVTSIGLDAFRDCSSLSSINIPSGVTSIGVSAFNGCSGLTNINIPSGVTSIENSVFNGCSSLTSIDIPSGVTSISSNAFGDCRSLTSIDIPDSVTNIGAYAFYNCSGLTSCTIGSGVTSIGVFALSGSKRLTSITVKATTPPTLGGYSLDNTNNCPIYVPCESLNTYKSASGWSTYASRITCVEPIFDGKWKATYQDSHVESAECETAIITENEIDKTNLVSVEIGDCVSSVGINAFKDYSTLSSVKLNEGLASIDSKSFMNCVNLLSVTFPASLNSIFVDSFSGCTGFQSITFLSETPIRVYSSTFYDSTCPIYVPAASVEDYKAAQGWSTYADRIQAIPTN